MTVGKQKRDFMQVARAVPLRTNRRSLEIGLRRVNNQGSQRNSR